MATNTEKRSEDNELAPEPSRPPISGSEFIRQQPASMSVADVVKKGAAEGIKVSPDLVRTVRRNDGKKSPKAKGQATVAKKAAAKGSPKKTAPKKAAPSAKLLPAKKPDARPNPVKAPAFSGTKAGFIRQFDEGDFTANEVVLEGKRVGVSLTANQVSAQRSADRSASRTKSKKAAPKAAPARHVEAPRPKVAATNAKKPAPAAPHRPTEHATRHVADRDEDAFVSLVVRLGLTRVEVLLAEVRHKLEELSHGG